MNPLDVAQATLTDAENRLRHTHKTVAAVWRDRAYRQVEERALTPLAEETRLFARAVERANIELSRALALLHD